CREPQRSHGGPRPGDRHTAGAAQAGHFVTVLRYHFSGVAGAGMGPLASLMRSRGHAVQGSDRAFDQGKKTEIEAAVRRLGIEIVPQDGRAITAAIDRVVYSAAVEADTPALRAARAVTIACLPRPTDAAD